MRFLALIWIFALACPLRCAGQSWTDGGTLSYRETPPAPEASAPRQTAEIIIHAADIDTGRFHRYSSKIHPYGNSVWRYSIAPDDAPGDNPDRHPVITDYPDNIVAVQFATLEELFSTIAAVAKERHAKIAVLNIDTHGDSGGIYVPQRESDQCPFDGDEENYSSYYAPTPQTEAAEVRKMSRRTEPLDDPCFSGIEQWRQTIRAIPDIKSCFTDDAQIHIFSCLTGLGPAGKKFTEEAAGLLLRGPGANLQTSLNYGLNDWSMPGGMGFWRHKNDKQLERDNKIYAERKAGKDIAQKGTIRLAYRTKGGQWTSMLVHDQDLMLTGRQPLQAPLMNQMPQPYDFGW